MARTSRALALLAACGLSALLVAGCAGSHLYNKQDHELAEQALEAFDEADISSSIDDEYELLDEMLDQELAVVRRQTLARRDAELVAIVGAESAAASWQFLDTRLDARERELVGGDPARVRELRNALVLLPVHERDLRSHEADYKLVRQSGDPTPTCPLNRPIDEIEVSPIGKPSLEQYAETCQKYQVALATVRRFTADDTLFGAINRDLKAIADFDSALEAQAAVIEKSYRALKKELAGAKKDKIDVGAKLEQARKKMLSAIAPYEEKAAQVFPMAERLGLEDLALVTQIAEIQEQRQAIDDLLAYLVTGEGEPPVEISAKIQLRLEIARTVPSIGLDLLNAGRYPRVSALVLESEHLRLSIQGLSKRRKRAEERAELLRKKRDAMAEELFHLAQTRAALARIPASARSQSLFDAYHKDADIRRDVADALLSYANAWTLGRVDQEEIDYRLIGLSHETALDASGTALAQWENLIRVPLTQLVALHGSGVTSEQVSRIVQYLIVAAGMTAVAAGVFAQ